MTDDRHPEELLAGYVDGTLSDRERAAVESHLSTCLRCREESALAMRAVEDLREMQEEPVPFGVMNPVTAEIARRTSPASARPLSQRVLGLAAAAAVAAAFIGLIGVWVLPNLGAGGGAADNAGGGAAVEAAAPSATRAASGVGAPAFGGSRPVPLERQSRNYDQGALESLARSTADDATTGTLRAGTGAPPQPAEADSASACLARGTGVEPQAVLVRLISARYGKEPALIGVYLTGPGQGQPPNEVIVWVVQPSTCQIASFTSKRI
ncbi:MAG TPA: zf-HC2 domain-containing protein [Actinomycetota bacterium]